MRSRGDLAAELVLLELGYEAHSGLSLAQGALELTERTPIRCHDSEAGNDDPIRIRGHGMTPIPDKVPEQTTVPSSNCISQAARSLRRR